MAAVPVTAGAGGGGVPLSVCWHGTGVAWQLILGANFRVWHVLELLAAGPGFRTPARVQVTACAAALQEPCGG